MKKLTAALILLACINAPAMGYTTFGAFDCGQWIKDQSPQKRVWLLGYMTGLSAMFTTLRTGQGDPLGKINSADQIYLWMDNYCTKNPLTTVATAGIDLYIELATKSNK